MLEYFVTRGVGIEKRSSPLLPTFEEAFRDALHHLWKFIGTEVY